MASALALMALIVNELRSEIRLKGGPGQISGQGENAQLAVKVGEPTADSDRQCEVSQPSGVYQIGDV
jgi:hypothetical protein